jgi:hypothetical protein
MDSNIRTDILYRLRWNLRAELHEVKIAVGPVNEEKLVSLFDHPAADMNFTCTLPGVSRLEVASNECLQKYELSHDGTPEPDGYQPPPSLSIENGDGKPITIRQFITEVHAYMDENMSEIKRALRGRYLPWVDDIIFFRCVYASETGGGNLRVCVSVIPGMDQEKTEKFWATQVSQARIRHRYLEGSKSLYE